MTNNSKLPSQHNTHTDLNKHPENDEMNSIVDDKVHSVIKVNKQLNTPTPTFNPSHTPKFTSTMTNFDTNQTINNSDKIYLNYYNRVNYKPGNLSKINKSFEFLQRKSYEPKLESLRYIIVPLPKNDFLRRIFNKEMNIVEFVNISQKCYDKLKNMELDEQEE